MIIQENGTADVSARAPYQLESLSEWRVDALVHVVGVTLGIAACLALAIVASPSGEPARLIEPWNWRCG